MVVLLPEGKVWVSRGLGSPAARSIVRIEAFDLAFPVLVVPFGFMFPEDTVAVTFSCNSAGFSFFTFAQN